MRIDSSTIGMESTRKYTSTRVIHRQLSVTSQREMSQEELLKDSDVQEDENDTKSTLDDWQNRFPMTSNRWNMRSGRGSALDQIRQQSLRYVFHLLFGNRRKNPFEELIKELSENQNPNLVMNQGPAAMMQVVNFQMQSYYRESEETTFSTVGTVKTEDGREISFNLEVGMSREFEEYFEVNFDVAQIVMCDPLVINLDGNIAGLSDQKFYFDIDCDGEEDLISSLSSGSGYLAIDKNGDGIINDGSELFGTKSGNGFADLAKYDEDGNGWIDENDAIWDKLVIWCKDENGQDVLYRLADKGIGAICLQNVSTDFTLKSGSETQGAIRNSGVFLYESGNVGTVQHVDVVKYDKEA